jgi:hypothetical protein
MPAACCTARLHLAELSESTPSLNSCAYDLQVGAVSGPKKAVEDPPPWRTLSFWLAIIVFTTCIVGIWWYGIDQLPVPP